MIWLADNVRRSVPSLTRSKRRKLRGAATNVRILIDCDCGDVIMGHEICKFKTGLKKVLPADSATADSMTFDTGDIWKFS